MNKAIYISEERRDLHKKIIWFIPFLGALLLRAYWKTKPVTGIVTTTKKDRRNEKGGSFHESGAGMYPVD